MFTRLFGNRVTSRRVNASIEENGCGKFNDIDAATLRRIKKLGCTHVWFTGVIRHGTATDYTEYGIPKNNAAVIKGLAGSPYAITDYYDVDPDMAVNVEKRMQEYEKLIERTHKAGMKVVMDFVPNHVAREYHSVCCPQGVTDLGADDNQNEGFNPQNNFYYCPGCKLEPTFDIKDYEEFPAKSTGNDHFDNHPGKNDWYETVKLNYGIDYWTHIGHFSPTPDTWHKMTAILMFWASKGVDAFRCDMAEMVPAAFWQYATERVKDVYPWIDFIGEVYDPNQYRTYIASGFDYLYDKVGMYDTVRAIMCGQCPAHAITQKWQQTDDIKEHMLYFLENHDEQRVASDFFAGNAQKGIPGLITSALMQQNPFMLYAGEEFGERGMDAEGFSGRDGRTTIFDYWCVDTIRKGYYARTEMTKDEKHLEKQHAQILGIATTEKAVSEGLFYDLMYANPWSDDPSCQFNPDRQYAFLRKSGDEMLIVVANFSDEKANVGVRIPEHAFTYLNITPATYASQTLFGKGVKNVTLKPGEPVMLPVEAQSGIVVKVNLKA